jgi:hypothetical protein
MMEEYIKKKRMRRKFRNDYEEFTMDDKNAMIITNESSVIGTKTFGMLLILSLCLSIVLRRRKPTTNIL